jgi:predicted RNase H-related nuclease YkuK (DUF458 family)
MDFFDYEGRKINAAEVVREITDFMREDGARSYRIMIGTDSALYNSTDADFVTAVVVHRVGNGARYFWRRAELKNFHTLRDRMIKEAMISLEIAQQIF